MDDTSKQEILEAIKANNTRIDEVLEAVGAFASAVDKQFEEMRSVMVTKDFLQDQLGILKGDMTIMVRGEDKKVIALVELMEKKKLLTPEEAKAFYGMEPFPKLMI